MNIKIDSFVKTVISDISSGIDKANLMIPEGGSVAVFPSEIAFKVPLDCYGNVDWDGIPSDNRKCEFKVCFYPRPSSSAA